MNELVNYINKFKSVNGINTDLELAEVLGMTKQALSRARKEGYLKDDQCITIARSIGEHPALVLIAREEIKEKNSRHSNIWRDAHAACKQILLTGNKDYRKFARWFQQLALLAISHRQFPVTRNY